MKKIKYCILREINRGTEESPDIRQEIYDAEVLSPDENFEADMSAIQARAYGEVTVEDIPDEPHKPTTEQRVAYLEEQLAQADETAINLYEAQEAQEVINAQQDEALMEIYEMIG